MTIVFDHTTAGQRVLFGAGRAVENAAVAVESLGATRVLLIAGAFAEDVTDAISARTNVVGRIHEVAQHVPAENALAAKALATKQRADVVIAIGGGSSTGLAKIIARDLHLPVIAVPTTFAGSEATEVWGLTEGERKVTGRDPWVLPKVVIYDAELIASLPVRLVVSSGLNAVAHAVDGFWAPSADPINRALGTESLRALVPALRALKAEPADLDAREQAHYGAYLAGVAFSSAGSGMHHKICHVLGGAYNLSHSEMHAIVLPYVTAFNAPAASDAVDRVSAVLGTADAAAGLFDLGKELGIPHGLKELGMPGTAIHEAAVLSLGAIPPSNPRPVSLPQLEGIIAAAWAGDPIT